MVKMQEACLTNYQYFFFVIEQSINSSDLLDNFNFLLHKPVQGIDSSMIWLLYTAEDQ